MEQGTKRHISDLSHEKVMEIMTHGSGILTLFDVIYRVVEEVFKNVRIDQFIDTLQTIFCC